ncbi:hypothetical protein VP395_09020 [Mariniflexile soesokkakense]|uniref:DUF6984 domain-containing protein n=1 Tax=Mariniflexile soesokkakense TaxID=1343160 RepID=A0ABV0ACE6_9FLAO
MRILKDKEIELIEFLTDSKFEIPHIVRDLNDGKMGSISFDIEDKWSRCDQIAAAQFIDEDGILVDVELTSNINGGLFELDFWKVDFSSLVSFPNIEKVKRKIQTTK